MIPLSWVRLNSFVIENVQKSEKLIYFGIVFKNRVYCLYLIIQFNYDFNVIYEKKLW